jgi:hypothetical protein
VLTPRRPATARRRLLLAAVAGGLVVLATPAVAAGLAVTVPTGVDLVAVPTGTDRNAARLGTISVTAGVPAAAAAGGAGGLRIPPSFVAQVSASDFVTGEAATIDEIISKLSIAYWSGPVTASSGGQVPTPGQPTANQAEPLATSPRAFSSSGLEPTITTSWNPTIVMTVPSSAAPGVYTGVILHSVA